MTDLADLSALFRLTVSPLELIVRGTVVYWFLFVLFRVVLRRDVGSIAIADVLLLVLIADASQNAMAGGYESISDGFILVATIALWNYALDWASFHSPALRRLVEAKPLPLIRDGRMLRKNMRRELITADELTAKLREDGVDDIAEVRLACLETDGEISILRVEGKAEGGGGARRKRPPA